MLSIKRIDFMFMMTRCKFTLNPNDLYIKNTLGWGAGGAKVASQKNCALVKHIPTGISVKCHDTRSLDRNISVAIKKLTDKVELHLYGSESSVAIKEAKRIKENKERRERNTEKMMKRIECNKNKREETEIQRQRELQRVLKMGLAFMPSNKDDLIKTDSDEGDCDNDDDHVAVTEEDSLLETNFIPEDISDDSSQFRSDSLKSLFGTRSFPKIE